MLQVVSDVVADLAQSLHQFADARQHVVEALGQPVEFVARARHRQPLGQIARHDAMGRGVDRVDAAQHPARDEQRAKRRERREEHERDRQRAHHDLLDAAAVAEIMSDQEAQAAGKQIDSDQRLPAAVAGDVGAIADRQEARMIEHAERNFLDVAGERVAGEVGQEIERGARLARAGFDDGAEPSHAALRIGVDEALGLRVDRLLDLSVDDGNNLPGDDHQHNAGADGAQGQNRQGEAEGRGAKELTERRHESCIRRRARC